MDKSRSVRLWVATWHKQGRTFQRLVRPLHALLAQLGG